MKLKTIFLFYLVILFLFSACSFESKITTIHQNKADINNLWLFTLTNYLVGVDPDTIETKVVVEFPVGIEAPIVANNKIYLGETNIFGWRNNRAGVIVLDENFQFQKEIKTVPNIARLSVYDNLLFTDCMSFGYGGTSAFSVIDLTSDELVYEYYELPFMITNSKNSCWGYDGKVYLGIRAKAWDKNSCNVTVVNTNPIEVLETTEIYTTDFPEFEETSVLVNKNQLWVCYRNKEYICVYDLDTNEKITSIDLRKYVPELESEPFEHVLGDDGHPTEWNDYALDVARIMDGVYYSTIYNYGIIAENEIVLNAIIGIDTETFEVKRIIRLNTNLSSIYEYKFSKENSDIVFLRCFNEIYAYSISTGELINEYVVFEK